MTWKQTLAFFCLFFFFSFFWVEVSFLFLDGHEFEQALGVGDGQGSLVCCSPWGHKESDMTERMN